MTEDNSKKIYFKFDNFNQAGKEFTLKPEVNLGFLRENFTNIPPDVQLGFKFSQVVESMIYFIERNKRQAQNLEKLVFQHIDVPNDNPYIVAITVQYAPSDWTELDYTGAVVPGKKSIFEHLNPRYIEDLRNGKAILLIDQSVEGYSNSWLWEWFHKKCRNYKINPNNIIYLTGDQACTDTYEAWCNLHNPTYKLKVIPSISLSIFIHKHCQRHGLEFKFDELLKYKTENSEKVYLFDCLNRRPRPQRIFNFMHLLKSGLVNDGNITMPSTETWTEWVDWRNTSILEKNGFPKNKIGYSTGLSVIRELEKPGVLPRVANYNYEHDVNHYFSLVERIVDDLYKHSWVSLVVESSFYKHEHNVFVSEKSFKPIAAMQPFVTVGSQHTLKYLRKLGYKTFHPFIDESYDDHPDETRYSAIMETLKKIKAIEDKAVWYESIRDILEHNYKLFHSIGIDRAEEHVEIMDYYFNYCDRFKNRK